jgi:hypothetical protein
LDNTKNIDIKNKTKIKDKNNIIENKNYFKKNKL